MTRTYICIKPFPNTSMSIGDELEIEKLSDGTYVIDGAIGTTRDLIYRHFKIKKLEGFNYSPYSHSKIETWTACHKKFHFNYILKPDIPQQASPILEKGTLFHAVLEHEMVDRLDEFELEDEFHALKKNDISEIVEQALEFAEKSEIYNWIKSISGEKIPEQEMFLGAKMEPVATIEDSLIRGFIDLLIYDKKKNKCYIFDWKTGGKSKEDLIKWPKPKEQLELYSVWANGVFGCETVETGFVYVEHDHIAKYTFDLKDIKGIKKRYLEKINNIETDEKFDKNVSRLCGWCDFRELCLGIPLDIDPKTLTVDDIKAYAIASKSKQKTKNSSFLDRVRAKNS